MDDGAEPFVEDADERQKRLWGRMAELRRRGQSIAVPFEQSLAGLNAADQAEDAAIRRWEEKT